MYEIDIRFGRGDMSLKEKVNLFAHIHCISPKEVWNEYDRLSDTQMTEERKWQYINSYFYKQKGVI